jgi:hypothetical protein
MMIPEKKNFEQSLPSEKTQANPWIFTFSKSSCGFSDGNPLVDGVFSRPQLVVVSGLFDGNPSMDGIFLGHNLLLSQAFSMGIPRWMGFF